MNRNTAQENIYVAKAKDPITITASFDSSSVDATGFETIQGCVYYGTNGDALDGSNYLTAKLQHSINNSDWVDIPDDNIVGSTTNAFAVNNSNADDNKIYTLGAKDFNKWVRTVITLTGSMTYGTPLCCWFNEADAGHADVGNTVQGS